jgi:ABC-2 type transport system ATP-binding protein
MKNAEVIIDGISKSYNGEKALDEVSFKIKQGELFGLIGPDGAGKTTLFRILTTLVLPDSGNAYVGKWNILQNVRKIRSSCGYMPGKFSLYQDLSVEENLEFFATTFGTSVKKNYGLIKDIYQHLEPFKNRRAGALSGGMKQKLALSCALIHRPEVLFLDEPTTGVDPVSRTEFWEILRNLKKEGITIMVSTPYMDEATICERIALIQKGKILTVDTSEAIRTDFGSSLFEVRSDDSMFQIISDLEDYERAKSVFAFGSSLHYTDKKDDETVQDELLSFLLLRGHANISVREISPDIEDRFMELMAETAVDI